MSTGTRTSLAIATAFATAAVAVPTTAASLSRPNDRASAPSNSLVTAAPTQKTKAERAAIARHRALGQLPVTAAKSQPSPVDRIIAQERGRRGDPLVFGLPQSEPASVQIVERPGGFAWGDAGIGGAATLAVVLLAAGAAALWHESRRQGAPA